MAKGSGTTRSSSSSNPKGSALGGGMSKSAILDGFDEALKSRASESYTKVKAMNDEQKGSIPASMSRAMDYTVAARMSKERNDLIDVVNNKGLWSVHQQDKKDGTLESGVFKTFNGGPLVRLSGMNVEVGVQHKSKSLNDKTRGGGGQRFSESWVATSKTKTYNIYKDKSTIRDLINMLKMLPS